MNFKRCYRDKKGCDCVECLFAEEAPTDRDEAILRALRYYAGKDAQHYAEQAMEAWDNAASAPSCGHAHADIVTGADGTSYCAACEREARA